MKDVYVLWHTHELDSGEEDSKLLGIYSSESIARGKIDEYKGLSGFNKYPEGFEIVKYLIDFDYWKEGFITKYPDE
jgi:hypothetical protein